MCFFFLNYFSELVFIIQYFAFSTVTTSITTSVSTEQTVVISSQVITALSESDISSSLALTVSGSSETYASLIFGGSLEGAVSVETSVQITFTETFSTTSYTELEGLFLQAMIQIDSSKFHNFCFRNCKFFWRYKNKSIDTILCFRTIMV